MSQQVRELLCKARTGEKLTREEALMLGEIQGEGLLLLLKTARELVDAHKGRTVSFSRKVFIPLTNLCRNNCGYCTFRKDPGDREARFLTPNEVLEVASRGAYLGCKEVLFSLGDKPEMAFPEARRDLKRLGFERTIDYLDAMCRLVIDRTTLLPHSNLGVIEERDLKRLGEVNVSLGLMIENISPRLTERGGPHEKAPDKVPAKRLHTLKQAGVLNIPFTTGILIGIGETWAERIDSLLAIDGIQRRYGNIQEVIVQNFRTKPTIAMRDWPEPTIEDHLRTIAVARLILGGEMNIQAPCNLSFSNYWKLISAGINDWGGISPVTQDFINPEAPWPHLEELHELTASCGYHLRERLAIYPSYIVSRDRYLNRALWPKVERLCGSDGWVT